METNAGIHEAKQELAVQVPKDSAEHIRPVLISYNRAASLVGIPTVVVSDDEGVASKSLMLAWRNFDVVVAADKEFIALKRQLVATYLNASGEGPNERKSLSLQYINAIKELAVAAGRKVYSVPTSN